MSKALAYIGGDIMTHGSQLARQEECDKIDAAGLAIEYYSPAQNKSINDKSNMTEEENNCLAEKICAADIERLWNSDVAVMCAEQSAIGTLCEIGTLFGWKYMCNKLLDIIYDHELTREEVIDKVYHEIIRGATRLNLFHCSDIRTNHLNEKDWRRSFSINQLLYGMILNASSDGVMNDSFDDVLNKLKVCYNATDPYFNTEDDE